MGFLRLTDEGLKFVYRCVWNEIVEKVDEPLDFSMRHEIYMALKNSNMKLANEFISQIFQNRK